MTLALDDEAQPAAADAESGTLSPRTTLAVRRLTVVAEGDEFVVGDRSGTCTCCCPEWASRRSSCSGPARRSASLAGIGLAAWFFVAFVPATVRRVTWMGEMLADWQVDTVAFWEALVFGTIMLAPRALTAAVAVAGPTGPARESGRNEPDGGRHRTTRQRAPIRDRSRRGRGP